MAATLGCLVSVAPLWAGDLPDSIAAPQAGARLPLVLELPLLDVPFNTEHGFSFPSIPQSLAITGGVTQGVHTALARLWHPEVPDRSARGILSNRRLGGLCSSLLVFDIGSPFPGWTHEEAHRAVLSRHGISSRNDIYRDPFAKMVSVSHVRDEDLVWLKAEHPADMVRLAEAGGEVQIESSLRMRKADFFSGRPSKYDLLDWWINIGGVAYYVWYCSDDEVNRITEEETQKEDADISKRDIVGGDYLSWVYDLFRPDEPYLEGLRGRSHPSGVGVDRYIQPSELAGEELRYLRRQGRLILLNLLSPQMLGRDRFNATDPITHRQCWWNAAVTHHLTSFGTATGLHLFFREGKTNLALTYESYVSRYRYWPGISIELVRYPIVVAGQALTVSAGVSGWLQPSGQRFAAAEAQGGGAVTFSVADQVTQRLMWYVEGRAKSEGWMAADVYLDSAVEGRVGLMLAVK